MEMADKEGWTKKNGSKWQSMPSQMLRYRAAAFWQRVYCPEISMGLITKEEADDIQDAEYEEIKPKDRLASLAEKAAGVQDAGDSPTPSAPQQSSQAAGKNPTPKSLL